MKWKSCRRSRIGWRLRTVQRLLAAFRWHGAQESAAVDAAGDAFVHVSCDTEARRRRDLGVSRRHDGGWLTGIGIDVGEGDPGPVWLRRVRR